MKYIVLYWSDLEGDGWLIWWYGTTKGKALRNYTTACKEHREVKLVEISILKEQE